jgi:hypothetical protein
MNKSFINQLIAFIATPYGLIGIAVCILIVFQASRSRAAGWLIFSCCCFASSLDKFQSKWMKEPPPLLFPLQQLRLVGRPLAIVLLGALIILALTNNNSWRQWIFPKPIKYLIVVQGAILFKTLLYGSIEFTILSTLTFGSIIFMMHKGLGKWLQDDENFDLAARSIAIAGAIFLVANTYQFVINRAAVTFITGRFSGTAANPQQVALLLAATIPCLLFLVQRSPNWNLMKFIWGFFLVEAIYFLFMTGSRMGLLMGMMSILLFYRNNGGAWLRLLMGLALVGLILIPFFEPATLGSSSGIDATVSDRFTSTNDTRGAVWSGMWQNFQDNILFGAAMTGDRMGYGENSWLSVGANLGLVGFIPMILMGWESLKLIWQLDRLSRRQPYYFLQTSVVISGLGSCLVGSLFEASLLGTITYSVLSFLIYLLMAGYLIEVDRVRTYYQQTTSHSIDRPGVYQ